MCMSQFKLYYKKQHEDIGIGSIDSYATFECLKFKCVKDRFTEFESELNKKKESCCEDNCKNVERIKRNKLQQKMTKVHEVLSKGRNIF